MSGGGKIEENTVKCVAVGDAAVGKTSLLITYTTGKFPPDYVPTVFDNYETKLEVNGEWFVFLLWDTAGAEHYDVLRPLSYSETDCFLIVYSAIDRKSFDNVESKWVADIKEKGEPGVPYILVGNKVDLRDNYKDDKPVTLDDLTKLKRKVGAEKIFEASALTKEGLNETFDGVITVAFDRLQNKRKKAAAILEEPSVAESGGCCLLL